MRPASEKSKANALGTHTKATKGHILNILNPLGRLNTQQARRTMRCALSFPNCQVVAATDGVFDNLFDHQARTVREGACKQKRKK